MTNNISSNVKKSLSFLQARDPSIFTANPFVNKQQERQNVKAALTFERLEQSSEESGDNIKIYLRIKNTENIKNIYKTEENEIHCYIPALSAGTIMKDVDTVIKKYQFSHIFDLNSSQEEIFNHVVKSKVLKFINGDNFTLMSYGASGSGKTYTMVGSISKPGIIPRTLEYLFKTLPELSEVPLVKPTQSGEIKILDRTCSQQEVNATNNLLQLAYLNIGEHTGTYEWG